MKDHSKKYEFNTIPSTTFEINFLTIKYFKKGTFSKNIGNLEQRHNLILVLIYVCSKWKKSVNCHQKQKKYIMLNKYYIILYK